MSSIKSASTIRKVTHSWCRSAFSSYLSVPAWTYKSKANLSIDGFLIVWYTFFSLTSAKCIALTPRGVDRKTRPSSHQASICFSSAFVPSFNHDSIVLITFSSPFLTKIVVFLYAAWCHDFKAVKMRIAVDWWWDMQRNEGISAVCPLRRLWYCFYWKPNRTRQTKLITFLLLELWLVVVCKCSDPFEDKCLISGRSLSLLEMSMIRHIPLSRINLSKLICKTSLKNCYFWPQHYTSNCLVQPCQQTEWTVFTSLQLCIRLNQPVRRTS